MYAFASRWKKLIAVSVTALTLGTAGVVAFNRYAVASDSGDDCCGPGAPCCYPGSPCCAGRDGAHSARR